MGDPVARESVLSAYVKAAAYGTGAGIFAAVVYQLVYDLWYPVFDRLVGQERFEQLTTDLLIAGLHSHAILALLPVLAGVFFAALFYRGSSWRGLMSGSILAGILMGTVFDVATTFLINPRTADTLAPAFANISSRAVFSMLVLEYVLPLLVYTILFIVFMVAGAIMACLMISRKMVDWKRGSLRDSGIVGLMLIALVAVVPPAAMYIAAMV